MKDNRMRASHRTLGSCIGILLPLALAIAPPFTEVAAAQSDDLAVKCYIEKRYGAIDNITLAKIGAEGAQLDELVSYAESEFPKDHWAIRESQVLRNNCRAIASFGSAEKERANEMFGRWRLGMQYYLDGKHDLCAQELVAAMELADDLKVADTVLLSTVLAQLAHCHLDLGNNSNAIACCNRSIGVLERHGLAGSPRSVRIRLDLVEGLIQSGQLFEADRECHRVHASLATIEKLPHDRDDTINQLGKLFKHRSLLHSLFNEMAEAESCDVELFRLADECVHLLSNATMRASSMMEAAQCKALLGKTAEAVRDTEKVDRLVKAMRSMDPGENGLYRTRRAEVMTLAGRFEEAQVDLDAAEQLFRAALGPTGQWVARHQFTTARLQIARGDVAQGRAMLRESVHAMQADYDPDSPAIIRYLVIAENEERADGKQQRAGELAAIRTRLERRVAEHRQAMNAEFGPLTRLQTTQALPASTPATAAVRPLPNTVAPASAARPGTAPRTR
jgi:hypothetical protein